MNEILGFGVYILGAVALIVVGFIAVRAQQQAAVGISPETLPIFTNLFHAALNALNDAFELVLTATPDIENTDLDDRIKDLLRIALDEALKPPAPIE